MTNPKTNNKKVIPVIGLVTFLLIIVIVAAPAARANFLSDLWHSLVSPLTSGEDKSSSEYKSVGLYKPVIDYEQAVIEAVKEASPAVVSITISKNVPVIENCPYLDIPPEFQQFFGNDFNLSMPCQKGTELREIGGGSGFIVSSDGLIITNKHVVSDERASYTVFTNDGRKYNAQILDQDPIQDLAIIKINPPEELPVVKLGDSDGIELGQSAIAIGNALGEFRNTVSVGVISGLSRNVTASGGGVIENIEGVIQTDSAINPGNSGGPLLNLRGEVIGINTAIVSGAQNIGFAIPINKAKLDIESVKKSGKIELAFLGVRYITITPDLAGQEQLPVDHGALVRGDDDTPGVISDSPAEQAGIMPEDIIIEINGIKIDQENSLSSVVSGMRVSDEVVIKILRQGKEIIISAILGKRP